MAIFEMAAIFDFQNFKYLTVGQLKRVEIPNHGENMTIFRFSNMATAVILDFENFKF